MRVFRFAVPVALAALFLAGFLHATAHAAPRVVTAPSGAYAMTNGCGSGSWCTETVTITANPSSYNVRAWMNCSAGGTHYGGWHTSGTTTAGCGAGSGAGYGLDAGFEYDKTHMYVADCWLISDPKNGSCQ